MGSLNMAAQDPSAPLLPPPEADAAPGLAKRRLMALLLATGIFNVYCMRVDLSVAIEPMADEFHWTGSQKGWILSAFYVGYLPCQILGSRFAASHGGKLIFGIAIGMTCLLTLLLPAVAHSVPLLIGLRILMGLFESLSYPSMYYLLKHWAPEPERTSIVGFCSAGAYAGTAVAFPISGWIVDHAGGWPVAFYAFGGLGLLWLALWWALAASTPAEMPGISAGELDLLRRTTDPGRSGAPVPWGVVLREPAVLAVYLEHYAQNWSTYVGLSWVPSFLDDFMGFNLDDSATLSVLPYVAMAACTITSGRLADYLIAQGTLTRLTTRRVFCAVGNVVPAVCFAFVALVNSPAAAIALLTLGTGMQGAGIATFSANYQDIAPRHSAAIFAVGNTIGTVPGIVGPALAGAMLGDDTKEASRGSWALVFLVSSVWLGLALLAFLRWARAQPIAKINGAEVEGLVG